MKFIPERSKTEKWILNKSIQMTKTSMKLFRVLQLPARVSLKQNDARGASSSRELLRVNKSHWHIWWMTVNDFQTAAKLQTWLDIHFVKGSIHSNVLLQNRKDEPYKTTSLRFISFHDEFTSSWRTSKNAAWRELFQHADIKVIFHSVSINFTSRRILRGENNYLYIL